MALHLWSIENNVPQPIPSGRDFREGDLETWVEKRPGMVLDGLTWVGRQRRLTDGKRFDLLGMTTTGQLVVGELKRGTVDVATLSQALDYVLRLGAMTCEDVVARVKPEHADEVRRNLAGGELEVSILLIGTAQSADLQGAVEFLRTRGLRIDVQVVTFTPFKDGDRVYLARDVEEVLQDDGQASTRQREVRASRLDLIRNDAIAFGHGEEFEQMLAVLGDVGLEPRAWPRAVTFGPAGARNRALHYIRPIPSGFHVGCGIENLNTFFGIDQDTALAELGTLDWRDLEPGAALDYTARLADLVRRHSQRDTT